MDSFTKICSSVVLQLVDLLNVSSILVDAVHFNALALVESLHGYMAKNLETLMEMHALDDLPLDVLKGFSVYSRKEQIDYHPYIRKGGNIAVLERRWASWLALQDIPIPFVPKYLSSGLRILAAPTPKEITSVPMTNVDPRISPSSSPRHPRAIPSSKVECEDEIFPMDGDSSTLAVKLSSSPASSTSRVWKSPSVSHKIDMKSIIQAEQLASDANKQQRTPVVGSRQVPSTKRNDPIERSMQGVQSPSTLVPLQRTPPTTQSMTSTSPHQSTLPTTAKQLQLPSTSSRHASSPWNTTTDALIPMSSRSRPPLQPIETSSPVDPSSNYMNTKPSATKVEHGPLIVPTKVKPPTNLPIRRTSSGYVAQIIYIFTANFYTEKEKLGRLPLKLCPCRAILHAGSHSKRSKNNKQLSLYHVDHQRVYARSKKKSRKSHSWRGLKRRVPRFKSRRLQSYLMRCLMNNPGSSVDMVIGMDKGSAEKEDMDEEGGEEEEKSNRLLQCLYPSHFWYRDVTSKLKRGSIIAKTRRWNNEYEVVTRVALRPQPLPQSCTYRLAMADSAVHRTPFEIWNCIILLAIKWHPVPSFSDYTLKHYTFSGYLRHHSRCHVYHQLLASERARLRMRLVCQSWNTAIKAMPLDSHYLLNDLKTQYWPCREGISRAACIELEIRDNISFHCICSSLRSNKSTRSTSRTSTLATIPNLHVYKKKYRSESQDTAFLVEGPIEVTMLLIRPWIKLVSLEQLFKNAPLLQALSWSPERGEDNPISSLENFSHLTHLELHLEPYHSSPGIITSPVTLPYLKVLLLKIHT